LACKENDVGLSVKNILDAVQNLRGKLNIIETTFDCSDKVSITNNTSFKKNIFVPQM